MGTYQSRKQKYGVSPPLPSGDRNLNGSDKKCLRRVLTSLSWAALMQRSASAVPETRQEPMGRLKLKFICSVSSNGLVKPWIWNCFIQKGIILVTWIPQRNLEITCVSLCIFRGPFVRQAVNWCLFTWENKSTTSITGGLFESHKHFWISPHVIN